MEEKRICKVCGEEKELTKNFPRSKNKEKYYYKWECKKCLYEHKKVYNNKYQKEHKEKLNEYNRNRYHTIESVNPEFKKKRREQQKINEQKETAIEKRRKRNRKESNSKTYLSHKKWRMDNSEKCREASKKSSQKKRDTQPTFRMANSISRRLRRSLIENKLSKQRRSWESIVGYSTEELKNHLESKFQPGMSWDNYGIEGWHIDHIIPIDSFHFNSMDDPEFKKCWSLENLQPLWAEDNRRKSNKIIKVA